MKTNNPTIYGVSRCKTCRGAGWIDCLRSVGAPAAKCPDCAPAVERQDEVQMASMPVERCYDVRAKMIIAFNEAKKAGGDLDDALDAAYRSALRFSPAPNDFAALQSTIARLEARVAELENGRGEPVAWNVHWSDNNEFYFTSRIKERADKLAADPEYKIIPLFTGPPAPVAVVLPDRKPRVTTTEESDSHVRMLEQIERNGWNACLDATAALNGVKP